MRATARIDGLDAACMFELGRVEESITGAMADATAGLKEDLRAQVRAAGLGDRLAKTWQSKVYPVGQKSASPAGFVWSKAPKIVHAFAIGATITAKQSRFLAIPTDAVPMKRQGRRMAPMSPEEVEHAFNQDLILQRGRGGNILGFVNVIRAKSRRRPGWRQGTRGRLAQGRALERVLMFTFVPRVRMPRLLDLQTLADKWGAKVPVYFEQRMGRA
jgi:hypothetical protein